MICQDAIHRIHDYLDGELQGTELTELNQHISLCPGCSTKLSQLEKTEAMFHYLPRSKAPDGMAERIMQKVYPPQKRRLAWQRWVKRHPAIAVASVFVLVMMGSFLSLWYQDAELRVQGADLDQLVFKGDTVIVPEGQTVNGDLLVENGKVQIDGKVNGNITVIDGTVNLASTAYISGRITKVNQALDWIWYKLNEVLSGISAVPN